MDQEDDRHHDKRRLVHRRGKEDQQHARDIFFSDDQLRRAKDDDRRRKLPDAVKHPRNIVRRRHEQKNAQPIIDAQTAADERNDEQLNGRQKQKVDFRRLAEDDFDQSVEKIEALILGVLAQVFADPSEGGRRFQKRLLIGVGVAEADAAEARPNDIGQNEEDGREDLPTDALLPENAFLLLREGAF